MTVGGMARLRSVNPATEEELASFQEHTAEELDRALVEADAAQRAWRRTSLGQRARVLVEAARLLRQRRPESARLATLEMGKPIAEAEAEVDKCAWNCEFYAEQAPHHAVELPVLAGAAVRHPGADGRQRRAAEHSPNVSQCALAIEHCWRRPAPHLACSAPCWSVTRRVGEATERLSTDPRLSAVTLTGTKRAGAAVGAAAGRAHEKCVLELGGSDPFIVLADADLSNVADQAARARFLNAGQSGIAAKRFIVEQTVAEEFERRLVDATAALTIGDPLDPATPDRPAGSGRPARRAGTAGRGVTGLGGPRPVGGHRLDGRGWFFAPRS